MKPQSNSHPKAIARWLITLFIIPALLGTSLSAAESVRLTVTPSAVELATSDVYDRLILTLGGPDGTVERKDVESVRSLTLDLFDEEGNQRPDGLYSYQLRGRLATGELSLRGSEDKAPKTREILLDAGFFTIAAGAFVSPEVLEGQDFEKLTLNEGLDVSGDIVGKDDACFGRDCTTGMFYGYYSFRLRENSTRLMFEDTSSTASFPKNDWALVANDRDNGGANYFAIQDCGEIGCAESAAKPLTVMSGAPDSSLFVDGEGDLGLGTAAPVVDIHVVDGNTPALRLEQDGSGGFTEQSWDVAGNEANFFIRDNTNGHNLPFRIRSGAPMNAIFIASDGEIGLGTESPGARLDVRGDIVLTGTVAGRDVAADGAALDAHLADSNNPHNVTAAQIGAEEAGTAAALIAAHEAAYDHGRLNLVQPKAGIAYDTDFFGNPASAVIEFATPFPAGTHYSVTVTVVVADQSKSFVANVSHVTDSGFEIFLDDGIDYLSRVNWIAHPVTE